MLYLFTGTDTEKAREKLNAAIERVARNATVVRITDAHAPADLFAALGGGGMFGGERAVVLDGTFANDEMREHVMSRLADMRAASEAHLILETALDAATRKQIEKYAEKSERFDSVKQEKKETIFALVSALQSGKRKELWVGLQRELMNGKVPEAIHGMLFWAAKQMMLRQDSPRARMLVAELAELPHEARRRGFDLEYALEHFVLSRV